MIEKIPSDLIIVTKLQNNLTLYDGNFLIVVEKKLQELNPGAQTTKICLLSFKFELAAYFFFDLIKNLLN